MRTIPRCSPTSIRRCSSDHHAVSYGFIHSLSAVTWPTYPSRIRRTPPRTRTSPVLPRGSDLHDPHQTRTFPKIKYHRILFTMDNWDSRSAASRVENAYDSVHAAPTRAVYFLFPRTQYYQEFGTLALLRGRARRVGLTSSSTASRISSPFFPSSFLTAAASLGLLSLSPPPCSLRLSPCPEVLLRLSVFTARPNCCTHRPVLVSMPSLVSMYATHRSLRAV